MLLNKVRTEIAVFHFWEAVVKRISREGGGGDSFSQVDWL